MGKQKTLEEPKQTCIKCGGRTALVSGYWYYNPDQEPYENGVIEPTERNESEAYMNGFICDDCDTIQDVFVDEKNYKSHITELEAENKRYREALENVRSRNIKSPLIYNIITKALSNEV